MNPKKPSPPCPQAHPWVRLPSPASAAVPSCALLTVLLEPLLSDPAAIADNADAWELQLLLAKLDQFAYKLASVLKKRFSSREIDFLHS